MISTSNVPFRGSFAASTSSRPCTRIRSCPPLEFWPGEEWVWEGGGSDQNGSRRGLGRFRGWHFRRKQPPNCGKLVPKRVVSEKTLDFIGASEGNRTLI